MKKEKKYLYFFCLLLMLLLISTEQTYSQFYRPFPEDAAIWTIQSAHPLNFAPPQNTTYETFCSYIVQLGDTSIFGTTYHKIYRLPCNEAAIGEPYRFADTGYIGGLRQNTATRHVYIYFRDDTTERLLYDFSNDTIGSTFPYTIQRPDTNAILSEVDTIKLKSSNGFSLSFVYTDDTSVPTLWGSEHYYFLIEGIGAFYGGLTRNVLQFNAPGTTDYNMTEGIECFAENNLLVLDPYNDTALLPYDSNCILSITVGVGSLKNGLGFNISPNPTSNYLMVNLIGVNGTCTLKVIDLMGNILSIYQFNDGQFQLSTRNLAVGMYLINIYDSDGKSGVRKFIKQ